MTTNELSFPIPQNHDAEAAVLGALLIDPDAILVVHRTLRSADFHRRRNGLIYEACLALFQRGEEVDPVTLAAELVRQRQLENSGGMAYIAELMESTPTSVNVEYYAELVTVAAAKRRIMDAGQTIIDLGADPEKDPETAVRESVDHLFNVQTGRTDRDFVSLSSLLDTHLQGDPADQAVIEGQSYASGYSDLDEILGGMQRSDLLILGARPGIGKSSLALNVCINVAEQGGVCAIFSLEMSAEQVAMRILAAESQVSTHQLRTGLYPEYLENDIVDTVGHLSELSVFIDDTPNQTTAEMRGKVQRLKLEHGLDFLIVDYLQLIEGSARRRGGGENRVQEITEISRSLKGLARDLDVPVLTCSQLSRVVEQRPGHRPQLSDLRDSGSIEQDADVVMFIHREDKHYTEEQWRTHDPTNPYPKNLAEVIVAKHRHGPTGSIRLYFREDIMRFELLAHGAG